MRGKGYLADSVPSSRRTPFRHLAARLGGASLPDRASLVDRAPEVFDQGQTGACTGHAVACAVKCRLGSAIPFVPSPAGIYELGLAVDRQDRSPLLDRGAEPLQVYRGTSEWGIRAIRAPSSDGRYSDADWPIPADGSDPVVPEVSPADLVADSADVLASPYAILTTGQQRRDDIRTAIANGIAVTVAVDASDNSPIQNYTGGVLTSLGYQLDHYVCVVGFDVDASVEGGLVLAIRNSWGTGYGEGGNLRIAGSAIDQLGDLYAADVSVLQ